MREIERLTRAGSCVRGRRKKSQLSYELRNLFAIIFSRARERSHRSRWRARECSLIENQRVQSEALYFCATFVRPLFYNRTHTVCPYKYVLYTRVSSRGVQGVVGISRITYDGTRYYRKVDGCSCMVRARERKRKST